MSLGVQPREFWRMTPPEFFALLDLRQEVREAEQRASGDGPNMGPAEIARRRLFLEKMKRRHPDEPAAASRGAGQAGSAPAV